MPPILSVSHIPQNPVYGLRAPWLVLLVDAVFFLGILFGSFRYCHHTHIFWSWHFVLVFHFLSVTCVLPCKQKSAPVILHDHSVGQDAGASKSGLKDKTIPNTWWDYSRVSLWASYKGAITLGNVPTYPHTSQTFGAPPLEAAAPHCRHFRAFSAAW